MGETYFDPKEYNLGSSDNPKHKEGKFIPTDELPDDSLNPEEALLAKEEETEAGEEIVQGSKTNVETDPRKYWAEQKKLTHKDIEAKEEGLGDLEERYLNTGDEDNNKDDLSDLEEKPELKFDERKHDVNLRYERDSNKNRSSYGTEQKPIYKDKRKGFGATIRSWFQQ